MNKPARRLVIPAARVLLSAGLLLCCGSSLSAQLAASPAAPPPRPKTVLVELFTSEGCSSCPPADELLRLVNGRRSEAGQLIVGLSEHVTTGTLSAGATRSLPQPLRNARTPTAAASDSTASTRLKWSSTAANSSTAATALS